MSAKSLLSMILAVYLAFPQSLSAQEVEIFTGPIDKKRNLPKASSPNYLADCLVNPSNRVACYMAQTPSNGSGLETGAMNIVTYVPCQTKSGVCLELATFNPDEKQRAPAGAQIRSVDVRIYFSFDKAELRSDEAAKLKTLAAALQHKSAAGTGFAIIGHTDAKGSDAYNCRLSAARARSVKSRLVALGVDAKRLRPIGAGEHLLRETRMPNSGDNRRVSFARLVAESQSLLDKLGKLCR